MLSITIDQGLDDPVYEQVAHQIRDLVASGALQPGTPLPAVRRLAGDLGVNLNTVARAYRLLEAEGFLVIRSRAGAVVAAPAAGIKTDDHERLLGQMRAVLAKLRQAGMPTDELLREMQLEIKALDGPSKGER